MRTTVVAVGRLKDARYRDLCQDYLARARRMAPLDLLELRDGRGAAPARAIEEEGARILAALPSDCHAVALDERGRQCGSVELAARLRELRDSGTRDLRFVVGGAWGLAEDVKRRCRSQLSLGPMTLPHELARVLLLEQIYRAWTIVAGVPYHHG